MRFLCLHEMKFLRIGTFQCEACKHVLPRKLFGANLFGKDYCCLCDVVEHVKQPAKYLPEPNNPQTKFMAEDTTTPVATPVAVPSGGPISAVSAAVGDVALLITKALPSTEQQLAAFKLRSPKFYARIMEHLYQKNKMFLRWHKRIDIDTRVEFINATLPQSARDEMKKMLHEDLGR